MSLRFDHFLADIHSVYFVIPLHVSRFLSAVQFHLVVWCPGELTGDGGWQGALVHSHVALTDENSRRTVQYHDALEHVLYVKYFTKTAPISCAWCGNSGGCRGYYEYICIESVLY